MTRLLLVKQGERRVWVAALVDEDVWTYVGNTGKFHRNEGVRDDYFGGNEAEYGEVGIAEARRLMADGVGTVDEGRLADSLARWRQDADAMDPEVVFASMVADLA
ncbi:hypothetical protein E0H75_26505 [Kribbella capetownensis]|uniref:Uncharacterized protein n=1 Tax=Kribbella capetownensis TaxID=1572659 RepID=A0A4R0JJ58_9ACTN|nr:hypothetical protein [Kribbella capetownensis]TCC46609.1 hypothetical protein E0H75_26505 [Kribbella capetownensis]